MTSILLDYFLDSIHYTVAKSKIYTGFHMTISASEIKKLAKLSRLRFSEEEYKHYDGKLTSIIEMVDQILDVDCEGIEPLVSVNDTNLTMREDVEEIGVQIEELFSNAPGKDADLAREVKCFIVPKVME